jgi:hypothetical protein
MRECAFTIVAKNYIGLAQILGQSLLQHQPETDFRIYVADEFAEIPATLPSNAIIAKNVLKGLTEKEWTDMTFKYDLTEFCTAIKPFCFEHIFDDGYDKAYYFDPDIYIFSSLKDISEALDSHTMVLTPQVVGIHTHYTGEHPEWAMNVNGIFNLGFCGIRNDEWGRHIVAWWQQRLCDQAFADRSVGQFTDQKWMDWMPALLADRLCVLQSLGMNMAPWNYFERRIYQDAEGTIHVTFRNDDMPQRDDRLVFVHFAGYDYAKLKRGLIERKRIEDLKEYDDLALVNNIYRDAIVSNANVFDTFITQTYSYATYDNGEPIAAFHRRLYHGLETPPSHPFSTGAGTFHEAISQRGMIIKEKIDNLSRRNIGDLEGKHRMLARFYKLLYRLIGYKRYVMFLKSLYFYCRPEMHTFLIKK